VVQALHQVLAPTPPAPAAPPVTDSGGRARTRPGSTFASTPAPARPGSTQTRQAPAPARGAPRPRPEDLRLRPQPAARAPAPSAAPAAPAEPGRLFVNSDPWGQLYVDGQLIGNTPKANLSLTAGPHTIRVLREGYEPFERTIQVGAGATVRLTDITLVQRP